MTAKQLREVYLNLIDEQSAALLEHRGGCHCYPNPPCWAHSTTLTFEEAIDLDFIDPHEEDET